MFGRLVEQGIESDAWGERVAIPLQTPGGGEGDAHDVPATRHGVAEGVQTPLRLDQRRLSVAAKTTPEVPSVTETTRGRTMGPMPTAPADWSPPPAITAAPAGRPVGASAATLRHLAGDLGTLVGRRRGRQGDVERAADLWRPSRAARSKSKVPEPSALSMA